MMQLRILDVLQVTAAILLTGGVLASAQPLPPPKIQPKPVAKTQVKIEPKAPQAAPAVVLVDPAPEPVSAPPPAPDPPSVALPAGSHEDWLAAAGISASDFGYVDFIVSHEGHYDPCVWNGGYSACDYNVFGDGRAYGVCQSFPGIKMATAGADWLTNPITQLRWCNSYAIARFGSWAAAYNYWVAHSNW